MPQALREGPPRAEVSAELASPGAVLLVSCYELGHQPFKKGKTYEERVSDAELKHIGKRHWVRRVQEALDQINLVFNPRLLHLGGGNANHLKDDLPSNARLFTNVEGMTGGIRLWTNP
jgi:polyphosphate glucokinase